MRLFIAIRAEDALKDGLLDLQRQMRACRVAGNYTKPDNLHLTLAFIGEYPDPEKVLEVMEQTPFRPFRLELAGVGSFGSLYWAGVRDPAPLEAFVRRLRRGLAGADIPFDRKRFSPHFTLIRQPDRPLPGLAVPAAGMQAARISLMRSDFGRGGVVYTEVDGVESE